MQIASTFFKRRYKIVKTSKIKQNKVLRIVQRRCREGTKGWFSRVIETPAHYMALFQADHASVDVKGHIVDLRYLLGRNEANFLEILHYYLGCDRIGIFHKGEKWIYNPAYVWAEKMGKCERSFKTYMGNLRDMGILKVEKLSETFSDQTNYYTIDYKRLKELLDAHLGIKISKDELPDGGRKLGDLHDELHDLIALSNTYKSNKSITENFKNLEGGNSRVEIMEVNSQSNYVVKGPEPIAREESGGFSIVDYLKTFKVRLQALKRNTRCVDMYEIIHEVLGEKVSGLGYLTKAICQRLGGALTRKFGGDLEKFREYLNRIRLSKYIMSSKFILTIFTLLSFSFIDRIIGGDLGIAQKEVSEMKQNNTILSLTVDEKELIKEKMRNEIDLLDEPVECKEARKAALNALGAALYKSWLSDAVKFKLDDSGVVIEAPNAFVRDKLGHHPDFILLREMSMRVM